MYVFFFVAFAVCSGERREQLGIRDAFPTSRMYRPTPKNTTRTRGGALRPYVHMLRGSFFSPSPPMADRFFIFYFVYSSEVPKAVAAWRDELKAKVETLLICFECNVWMSFDV
jgi:hypothetical protein